MPKKQLLNSHKATGIEAAYETDVAMRRTTPNPAKVKRTVPIQIWLTPDEHTFIKVEAAKRGEKFSAVGRELLFTHYGWSSAGGGDKEE